MQTPSVEEDSSRPAALFDPLTLGSIKLPNRVVMAPLTRLRSGAAGVPGELMTEYYTQRAGFGMIVTEGTYPSYESQAYVGQPGIANSEQAAGWRTVTGSVHARGGRIVLQLMHAGRSAHPSINGGRRVIGPSPVANGGTVHTALAKEPFIVPREMTSTDIDLVVQEFATAAGRAMCAGFDGVEIHGANGYLLHQFLAPNSNLRTDRFGGGPAHRARFAVDVVTAVAGAIGADRVGLRLSPGHNAQGIREEDHAETLATYRFLLKQLRPLGLAYLSVLHPDPLGAIVQQLREQFAGPLILNSGFATPTTAEEAQQLVQSPLVDAVAVGRAAIANPDLVARWRTSKRQNPARSDLFYAHTAEGYTDYPVLDPR